MKDRVSIMKLNDLVKLTAEFTGISMPTVKETARSLQKADLIQIGKPGRYGGAQMTDKDAAYLSIALVASGETREAPALVKYVSEMKPDTILGDEGVDSVKSVIRLFKSNSNMTLFDLIVRMISQPCFDLSLQSEDKTEIYDVSVTCEHASFSYNTGREVDGRVEELFDGVQLLFSHPSMSAELVNDAWKAPSYIVTRTLNQNFFRAINAALHDQAGGK
jgi:hypothetical protein